MNSAQVPAGDRAAQISLQGVSVAFSGNPVLSDFSLDIYQGEFLTFFGPNGCGKSTLLNVIAGTQPLDQGTVRLSGAESARIGFVFQDYRGNLMPWLTVAENIAFPLRLRGIGAGERRSRVEALHARYGFDFDLNARTYSLSGGQAQLTSILRGLIINPDILILDEPFSALDYQTCLDLYEKLLIVWEKSTATVLMVSHNIDEALYLGSRTVFLSRRPASLAAILESDLPRPREVTDMGSIRFASAKAAALEIFRREIAKNRRKVSEE